MSNSVLTLDEALQSFINYNLTGITAHERFENHDVVTYYGPIDIAYIDFFRSTIERLISTEKEATGVTSTTPSEMKLVIILHTGGGSVETVEKFVEITRHFYGQVDFIVPEYAMSAGTIWCMSGDNIFMNYSSSLGPIDPQVKSSNGKWIPALGYLDQFNELIRKSADNTLTRAEMLMLNSLDLAELQRYKQAAELSKDLLRKWLVAYKFKDWDVHQTSPGRIGQPVSIEEKQHRAEEIAKCLNDTSEWRSHSRFIGVKTLQEKLRLRIDDYSEDAKLVSIVNQIHQLILQFLHKTEAPMVIFWKPRHLSIDG
jgi:hypothetical protein